MSEAQALEPATVADPDSTVFVGRQPIFDRKKALYGYELLFRDGSVNAAAVSSDEFATSHVLSTTFLDIGFDQIVGTARAFINCPRSLLINDCHLPIDRVVLELLETLVIDDALIEGCRARKQQGYMLALDDFVYSEKWEPLIELADIIKIDVLDMPDTEVAAMVDMLKGRGVTLLAEKVETREQYQALRDFGFHYFQGYFLSRPEVVEGRRVQASAMATLQLLGELQKPSILPKELEQLISRDVNLSYKLLRFVNSPVLGLAREVDSLRHAVVLIGLAALKHWVTLIALTAGTQPPAEVTKNALARARMCELLATTTGEDSPATFFMVGLLSSLEHFLHVPLTSALEVLSLNDECEAALLSHTGPMGKALKCAMAYEVCDWDSTQFNDLTPGEITTAFANASEWATQSYAGMMSD